MAKNEGPSVQEQIDAALNAAFSAAPAKSSDFIGLPSQSALNTPGSYRQPIQTMPPGVKHAPVYEPGAEYMPQLDNWDPLKTFQLQTQLVGAGLLDDDFQQGVWDEVSANAFTHILADANRTGNPDYTVALQARVNSRPMEIDPKTGLPRRKAPGSGKNKRAPMSLVLSNSDNLAESAQEVAQKRLGRTFTQQELQRFVSSFHATERGVQTSDYNASNPDGSGGVTEAGPSAEVAANTYAEQVDPVASQARNILPMVKSISDLLNGDDFDTTTPMQGSF